ncbi:neuropeptide S receptor-like [Ptychodera flava]|uniref:neuropeptide S receptor-like n=1 Tax=Ptychodera flava TaxID=63121 RepID=UPI00396A21A1
MTMCRTYVFTWFLSLTVSCVSLGLLSVTRAMGVSGKFSSGAMKLIIVGSISVSFVAGSVYAVARAVMAPQRFCLIDEMPADIVHVVNKIGFALIFDTLLMVSVSYGYVFCLKYKQRKTAKFLVQNSSNINKRDVATIRICFVLVVAYIVAYLPIGIFAFLHGINAIPRNLYYSRLVYSISYCGSMVNPIIYCLMSSKFRQHVLGCVPEKKAVVKASSLGSGTSSTPNRPTVDQKVHETSIVQTISSAIDNGNLVPNNGTAEMTEVFGVDNLAIEID